MFHWSPAMSDDHVSQYIRIFTSTDFGTSVGDVELTVGNTECVVSSVNDNEIVCSTGRLPVGDNQIQLRVNNLGKF